MSQNTEYDETYSDSRERHRQRFLEEAVPHHVGRRIFVAIVFAIVLLLAISALAVRQATSPASADRILGSGIADITELDRLLAQDLNSPSAAKGSNSGQPAVPGFPIQTGLTTSDISGMPRSEVRSLVLERSVAQVYNHGIKAFDRTGNQSVSRFSGQGLLTVLADQITHSNYNRATTALIVLGVLTALLAGVLLMTAEPGARVRSLGAPILAAGVAGLLVSAAMWFIVGSLGSSDSLDGALRSIGRAVVKVPLRDFVIVLFIGMALFVAGPIVNFACRRLGWSSGEETNQIQMEAEDDDVIDEAEEDREAWEPGA